MELTKEEMKKVIKWLEDYYVLSDYKPEDFPDDIDGLPTIVHKFKTYLERRRKLMDKKTIWKSSTKEIM